MQVVFSSYSRITRIIVQWLNIPIIYMKMFYISDLLVFYEQIFNYLAIRAV